MDTILCRNKTIEIVDVFSLPIEIIVKKYKALMGIDLNDDRSILVSKDIIYALETIQYPIFPDFKTCFFMKIKYYKNTSLKFIHYPHRNHMYNLTKLN